MMEKKDWLFLSVLVVAMLFCFSRPHPPEQKMVFCHKMKSPVKQKAKSLAKKSSKTPQSSLLARLPLPLKKMNEAMKALQDFDVRSDEKAGVVKNI